MQEGAGGYRRVQKDTEMSFLFESGHEQLTFSNSATQRRIFHGWFCWQLAVTIFPASRENVEVNCEQEDTRKSLV